MECLDHWSEPLRPEFFENVQNFNRVDRVEQSIIGVHAVETYDLWLTSQGNFKVQIQLGFVVRSPGNMFYKKEGCGLITTSIPFFQAP